MGVVVPAFTHWFSSAVLEGVDVALRTASYDLVLYELGIDESERERAFNRSLLRKRTDAVLALCMDFTLVERERLSSAALPTIVVGGRVKGLRSIGINDQATARAATEHLIHLGHTDIVHLNGRPEAVLNPLVPEGRQRGYEQALRAAQIPIRKNRQVFGDFTINAAREVMHGVLATENRPTAVFASSDEMAIGAILAAGDCGLKVPSNLSVIGIDGHPLGDSFGLSTFAQDPSAQGELGANALLKQLDNPEARMRSITIRTTLIERATTAFRA